MERSQSSLVLFVGSLELEKLLNLANLANWIFFPIEPREVKLDMTVAEGVRPFSRLGIFSISSTLSPLRILPIFTLVSALGGQHLEDFGNLGHELLVSLG
jgi:hypothetical protein